MLRRAESVLKSCNFIFLEVSWLQIYDEGPTQVKSWDILPSVVFMFMIFAVMPCDFMIVD